MPKLRQKKSDKQLAALAAARSGRRSFIEPERNRQPSQSVDLSVENGGQGFPQSVDSFVQNGGQSLSLIANNTQEHVASDQSSLDDSQFPDLFDNDAGDSSSSSESAPDDFTCAFAEEETLSFYVGEADRDYYHDSGNEEDEDDIDPDYIPHGKVFGRKHNMLFEEFDGGIRLTRYNGDDENVVQILGVPYHVDGQHVKSTIGYSKHKVITQWSLNARYQARSGIRHPKLTRTKGCRSVRDCLLSTDDMSSISAFPFFLYARGKLAADKVKGVVRRAVQPQYVYNSPDCTETLQPFLPFILQKVAGAERFLTAQQRLAVADYVDKKGFKIIPATGYFGPKVVRK